MSALPRFETTSAPQGSQAILEATQEKLGTVPNLFGVLAGSPATLGAYTALDQLQSESDAFDATERQVLFMSVSFENECNYCMAAHSTLSAMQKVPAEVVTALRDGSELPTPRLEALRSFTKAVLETQGRPSEAALQAFFDAGYSSQHVLEVILGIAFKTLSNYTNHIADTPLDQGFAKNAWSKPVGVS